jgi:hypothetical protein
MKKILPLALTLTVYTAAKSQTPPSAESDRRPTPPAAATPRTTETPATKPATAAATDDSANYVGTNDFYLALVREGVRAA